MVTKLTFFIALIALVPFSLFGANSKDSIPNDSESWDKLSIKGGAFLINQTSSMRFGSEYYGIGVDINFEDAFDMDVFSYTGRVDMLYRFSKNKKHNLQFGYLRMVRNSSKNIETELVLGDYTFSAGTNISTSFKMSIFKLNYGYSLYMDDRVALTASAGMFMLPSSFTIKADGKEEEQTDFVAPLPVLGIGTEVKITPKFNIVNTMDLFYLSFDEFDGVMFDFNVSLEYSPWDHVGFGLGYNSFNFDFSLHSSNDMLGGTVAEVGYKYSGVLLYCKLML